MISEQAVGCRLFWIGNKKNLGKLCGGYRKL